MPEVTISIPCPIHKASNPDSDEASRYSGSHHIGVFVSSKGDSIISATDGRMLAIARSKVSGLGSKPTMLVPHQAAKACKKTRRLPDPYVMLNGRAEVAGGVSFPLPEAARPFPDVGAVLPKREHMEGRIVVSLDPKALLSLAEALGSGGNVSLIIDPAGGKPIAVLPSKSANVESVGLLMPTVGGGNDDREEAIKRLEWSRDVVTRAVLG